MRVNMRALIGMLAIVTLAFGTVSWAGTIHVDVSDLGSVIGSGQPDPYSVLYKNIKDALTDAAENDTIVVATGTYPEVFLIEDIVTLVGDNAATSVITDTGLFSTSYYGMIGIEADKGLTAGLTVKATGNKVCHAVNIVGTGNDPTGDPLQVSGNIIQYYPRYVSIKWPPIKWPPIVLPPIRVFPVGVFPHDWQGEWEKYAAQYSLTGFSLKTDWGTLKMASLIKYPIRIPIERGFWIPGTGVVVYSAGANGVLISNNTLAPEQGLQTHRTTGILVTDGAAAGTEAHYNIIISGNGVGVRNNDPDDYFNATHNYWGAADGPRVDSNGDGTPEYDGSGSHALGLVLYQPWYATATTTEVTENVLVYGSPLKALSDTIQGGVDAARAGDTVEVKAGTYDEHIVIDKAITFIGAGASNTSLIGHGSGTITVVGNGGGTIGTGGTGFHIKHGIDVATDVNASTLEIHWNDIEGDVTNNDATHSLDAIYNYWYTRDASEIASRTSKGAGTVLFEPTLPMPADDSWGHANGLMTQGVSLEDAVLILPWIADGYSYGDALVLYLLGSIGADDLASELGPDQAAGVIAIMNGLGVSQAEAEALGAQYNWDLSQILAAGGSAWANTTAAVAALMRAAYPTRYAKGSVGGGSSYLEDPIAGGAVVGGLQVEGRYQVGEVIDLSFWLADEQTGELLIDAGVNLTVCKVILMEDGSVRYEALNYYGVFGTSESTGMYSYGFDTSGLEAGYYDLWLGFSDGTSERIRTELI